MGSVSPVARKQPRRRQWADWAYPLAYELRKLWTWLRGEDIHQLAATLGSRLGDQWTAPAVVDLVTRHRGGRALPVDKHSPTGLLRELLDDALTGELEPALPARRRDEHLQRLAEARQAAIAAEAQARRSVAADARVAYAERDQVAAGARAAGVARARAALAQAAGRRGIAPAEDGADGWPQPAQPGSGRSVAHRGTPDYLEQLRNAGLQECADAVTAERDTALD